MRGLDPTPVSALRDEAATMKGSLSCLGSLVVRCHSRGSLAMTNEKQERLPNGQGGRMEGRGPRTEGHCPRQDDLPAVAAAPR